MSVERATTRHPDAWSDGRAVACVLSLELPLSRSRLPPNLQPCRTILTPTRHFKHGSGRLRAFQRLDFLATMVAAQQLGRIETNAAPVGTDAAPRRLVACMRSLDELIGTAMGGATRARSRSIRKSCLIGPRTREVNHRSDWVLEGDPFATFIGDLHCLESSPASVRHGGRDLELSRHLDQVAPWQRRVLEPSARVARARSSEPASSRRGFFDWMATPHSMTLGGAGSEPQPRTRRTITDQVRPP